MNVNLQQDLANEWIDISQVDSTLHKIPKIWDNANDLIVQSFNDPESIVDESHSINENRTSLKDEYLWEIDNVLLSLENEIKRLELSDLDIDKYYCSIIHANIKYLSEKYELIKDSTEEQIVDEWSDYDLIKELKVILSQCIRR